MDDDFQMPAHDEYTLNEFLKRLAEVEEKFANELRLVTECFSQSRLDLPAKKLDDIGKVRLKAAKNLKKIDRKKSDEINLWKVCNIYSVCAVDTDNAMREIRKCLRKIIVKTEEKEKEKEKSQSGNGRRLGDDYRPQSFLNVLMQGKKVKPSPTPRTTLPSRLPGDDLKTMYENKEEYDKFKPTSAEAHTLSMWRHAMESPAPTPTTYISNQKRNSFTAPLRPPPPQAYSPRLQAKKQTSSPSKMSTRPYLDESRKPPIRTPRSKSMTRPSLVHESSLFADFPSEPRFNPPKPHSLIINEGSTSSDDEKTVSLIPDSQPERAEIPQRPRPTPPRKPHILRPENTPAREVIHATVITQDPVFRNDILREEQPTVLKF